ncbi:MAG: OmpH family outer membrane protein [Blastocatellia bacterium]|nr:OmpH family outer membrane protein [Blastocatellia bacterium]
MFKIRCVAFLVAVLAVAGVSASAQQAAAGVIPEGKVAVINTAIFPNEIAELKQKYEQVNNQYKQRFDALQALDQQLKQLENEIAQKRPTLNQDTLRQMQDRYDDMKKRGTRDYEDLKAEVGKTLENATKPVQDKLFQAIQAYAQKHGIIMIISLPGVAQTGSVAYWNAGLDITDDFVKEYNKANPVAGATPAPPAAKPATGKPSGNL